MPRSLDVNFLQRTQERAHMTGRGSEKVESKNQCTCGSFLGEASSDDFVAKGTEHRTLNDPSVQNPSLRHVVPDRVNPVPRDHKAVINLPFDASFIQVPLSFREPLPPINHGRVLDRPHPQQQLSACGSDYLRRLSYLHSAAISPHDPPPLCSGCLYRVEQALENDADRLQMESLIYDEAVQEDESRLKRWRQAMHRAASVATSATQDGEEVLSEVPLSAANSIDDLERNTEEAFRIEIERLEEAYQQHFDELRCLQSALKEQAHVDLELDRLHGTMEEEMNALELEARAYDNDQEQLMRELAEIQDEAERLSSREIRLPATLLNLQVDIERGLRYPLINELRLAYRPKGDLQWKEIQTAWALAAELLLVVASLFKFQSQNWRIVPLSHCAKLIYRPNEATGSSKPESRSQSVVFNLGHPKVNRSKSLISWNALMCQVVHHVSTKTSGAVDNGILDASEIEPLPFPITSTSIGGISLSNLDDSDDVAWSRVIHCMASDLLWLSNCASSLMLQQVLLLTPLTMNATFQEVENC